MTDVTHKHVRPNLGHPGVLLATWFGAGYLPKAPGTWGSIGALPFAWVLVEIGGLYALGAATVVVFFVGLWASKDYMARTGAHDPGAIVIDEVVGQWIVLLAAPLDLLPYALAFVLFRVFDVLKPWPISWADRSIGGAMGVMVDDVLAGVAGLAVLYALILYAKPFLVGVL
ncbi:phosphatidylglycerophosphatase A [Magnetovibrio sp.]|uniref:phosphatidylglycerophosphatase A family protein n=1 Tax=Magnetovibrio sp. TaxID=2024836 RepID=UPI002F93A9C0